MYPTYSTDWLKPIERTGALDQPSVAHKRLPNLCRAEVAPASTSVNIMSAHSRARKEKDVTSTSCGKGAEHLGQVEWQTSPKCGIDWVLYGNKHRRS